MTDQNYKKIEEKLDIIIKLLSMPLIVGKTQTDSIIFLSQMGFDRNVIATIVGASPAVVSTRISEAKSVKKVTSGGKNG